MLHPIRRPPVLAALAALVLAACAEPARAPAGCFEVSAAPSPGLRCEAAGELRLEGIDTPAAALVSGGELCSGSVVRHELPPGLYRLSWQSAAPDALSGPAAVSPLHGPSVVSLLPGQTTRLHVEVAASSRAALVATGDAGHADSGSSVCSHGTQAAGAS